MLPSTHSSFIHIFCRLVLFIMDSAAAALNKCSGKHDWYFLYQLQLLP